MRKELPRKARSFCLAGVVCLLLGGAGCTNVRPWQRGALADITMKPDRETASRALSEHMWFSRETANGGRGIGGGGCGCN